MHLDIPGSAEDYVMRQNADTDAPSYKAIRSRIRALVDLRQQKIQEVIDSGGNPHTASLDMNDQINEFISNLPIDAQVAFLNTMTEETHASISAINDETQKINSRVASDVAVGHAIGKWVGAGILFLFILLIFGFFK